ncbi:carbohydrate kinase [Anaerobacillus alkalidiazotrophicus]|uniref:Carbohydrate kinase n=1 Tax=Anaerobacillus alkalidiazotrophicus TaxID=472963 RepID=A0A1S2MAP0_9BACI|nr:aminoimidazole riboside kinase [Anaerobacillus alkalidiazotrophicus]OIJ21842.1 carbohydrate kinase [Anaerobacillus alkalidiazotrophicus]
MKKGVISLGEALIDFIPMDHTNLTYIKSPGGAPANVAVGIARLGTDSTFLGKVGDDVLGHFLEETLQSFGVITDQMFFTKEVRTGAVFVTLAEDGERSFDFYIDPSADRFLSESDLDERLFQTNKVLHFGSISLISEPSKSATKKAVQLAKENGMIVSYDPNLRLGLWENEEVARETIISMLGQADVLKISEEELEFITGEKDIDKGVAALSQYKIPLILITLGSEGSYIFLHGEKAHVEAMKVNAVDTTGAGDAFVSGILYNLEKREDGVKNMTLEEAKEVARFASVSGGLAASTKGAMTALPTFSEVEKILRG